MYDAIMFFEMSMPTMKILVFPIPVVGQIMSNQFQLDFKSKNLKPHIHNIASQNYHVYTYIQHCFSEL